MPAGQKRHNKSQAAALGKAAKRTKRPKTQSESEDESAHSDLAAENVNISSDEEEEEKYEWSKSHSESESEDEEEEAEEQEDEDGLFDNLDEEMDPSEIDKVMQELGEDDASDKEQEENKNDQQEQQPTFTMKPRFRDLYMAQLTRAFGTDLDKIRQEPNFNESRLGLLIDSLEAGIDIFSNFEQDILSASAQNE